MDSLSDLKESVRNVYDRFYGWYIAVAMGVFVFVFGLISYLGSSNTTSPPTNMGIPVAEYVGEYWATYIANIAISVPLTLIVIWLLLHLIKVAFNINLIELIKRVFDGTPIADLINTVDHGIEEAELGTAKLLHSLKIEIRDPIDKITTDAVKPFKKSSTSTGQGVFNIPSNIYSYGEAPAACASYNSRIATYREVEAAYGDNKEWCNYGWTDGQLALFPTQQESYDKLQSIKGHEKDCGRPGVNGGHFDADTKFGVNCFGIKPANF